MQFDIIREMYCEGELGAIARKIMSAYLKELIKAKASKEFILEIENEIAEANKKIHGVGIEEIVENVERLLGYVRDPYPLVPALCSKYRATYYLTENQLKVLRRFIDEHSPA